MSAPDRSVIETVMEVKHGLDTWAIKAALYFLEAGHPAEAERALREVSDLFDRMFAVLSDYPPIHNEINLSR